jgi:hypothetical protein
VPVGQTKAGRRKRWILPNDEQVFATEAEVRAILAQRRKPDEPEIIPVPKPRKPKTPSVQPKVDLVEFEKYPVQKYELKVGSYRALPILALKVRKFEENELMLLIDAIPQDDDPLDELLELLDL